MPLCQAHVHTHQSHAFSIFCVHTHTQSTQTRDLAQILLNESLVAQQRDYIMGEGVGWQLTEDEPMEK